MPTTPFPKRFLWGAAISAHQVEGGNHNQWSVWELENARSLAAQSEYQYGDLINWPSIKAEAKRPDNYVSGAAVEHYTRYKSDIAIAKKMNMNALRFSVEWSRIEPTEGAWNVESIAYYKAYVAELKRQGIEPMLTLFHFTLPVWFAERGGFEKRSNVRYFTRFAEKILSELGADITYVITINEPEVYAVQSYHEGNWPPALQSKTKAFKVLNNLAYAHNKVANLIHGMSRRYKVSVAKNSNYIYPGDNARLSVASAHIAQFFQDDYFIRKVVKSCDFLGVNYYFSERVYGYRIHNPDEKVNDLGWDMAPADLEHVLERLYQKYKLPIIITENGCADVSDEKRQWWMTHSIGALQRALSEGVDVRGYLHWSLLDNFEWDKGRWPRFGLVEVNYDTMERIIRPSGRRYGAFIKKIRGEHG
jgi:beta-glucosidase